MKLLNKSIEYFINDFKGALLFNQKIKKTSWDMAVQPEEGNFKFNALLMAFKGIQKGNH